MATTRKKAGAKPGPRAAAPKPRAAAKPRRPAVKAASAKPVATSKAAQPPKLAPVLVAGGRLPEPRPTPENPWRDLHPSRVWPD